MTLFAYKVFMTIVSTQSFRKAADELSLTPSAVSHCITGMEEELGFPLFIRKNNKIALTDDGKQLIPYIRTILGNEDAICRAIDEINKLQRGCVRLGCFNSVCTSWVPKLVKAFSEKCPGIKIKVFQGTYANVVSWLESGEIDIGFLSVSSAGGLKIHPLYYDRLMAVVPKGWESAHEDYVEIKELINHPFVVPMENGDADSQNALLKYGYTVESSCHVVDDLSTLTLVEAGLGVCILPEMLIKCFNVDVDIYPIKPEEYRVVGVAAFDPALSVPAVKILYDTILELFEQKNTK